METNPHFRIIIRLENAKARSAQNSRKHGFAASTFEVVRLEDLQEVDNLRADLIAIYQPANSQELFAIERIALAQQAILRIARLESGLLTACLNEALDTSGQLFIPMSQDLVGDGDIQITQAQNRNYASRRRLPSHDQQQELPHLGPVPTL